MGGPTNFSDADCSVNLFQQPSLAERKQQQSITANTHSALAYFPRKKKKRRKSSSASSSAFNLLFRRSVRWAEPESVKIN